MQPKDKQVTIAKTYENPLTKNLQVAITDKGGIEVKNVDKVGINVELKKYKHENNSINFPALFEIPTDNRITAMAERDLGQTIKILSVALTLCFETMNLSRPMQAFQILDLAEIIVDESKSDKLAIEDVMLFCQKLTRGEYPNLYEGMDIPKFMERFNQYRDERWNTAITLRDSRHEQYKTEANDNYYERANPTDASPFGQYLKHFKGKVQAKNDEIREKKGRKNGHTN